MPWIIPTGPMKSMRIGQVSIAKNDTKMMQAAARVRFRKNSGRNRISTAMPP
jgi:hypothetical protein